MMTNQIKTNQNILLNVMFIQTLQECVEHNLLITARSSQCMEITDNISRKFKVKQKKVT